MGVAHRCGVPDRSWIVGRCARPQGGLQPVFECPTCKRKSVETDYGYAELWSGEPVRYTDPERRHR